MPHRLFAALLLFGAGCQSQAEPCQCEPARECPEPPECPVPAASAAANPVTSEGRIGLAVAKDLFAGRHEAVRERFVPRLRNELTVERLTDLVAGVESAHGAPAAFVDAWLTTADSAGRKLRAAAVLIRMTKSDVRFRLLVVFDREGIDGLWLRPI